MKTIEFLEHKINEHYKNGGSALNINTSLKTIICEWMDEYKQFCQPTVISAVCECENLPKGEIAVSTKALTDPNWTGTTN